jgi:hypothetical protein
METAYQALQQLDPPARTRALHWLSDALGAAKHLPTVDTTDAEPAGVREPLASTQRRGRAQAAAATVSRSDRRSRVRGGAAVGGAKGETDTGGRAYRRMPPAGEVLKAYQEVGTVSGLAEYYGVPRHTVQGWARRLRREGYTIGQGA